MMTRYGYLTILAIATLTLIGSVPATAQTGSIIGVIEDAEGLPETEIIVRIPGTMIGESADDLGRFALHGVPAGVYTLQVLRYGRFEDSIEDVRVTAGDTLVVRHRLPAWSPDPRLQYQPDSPPPPTPLGISAGLSMNATPVDPILSVQAGVRYGLIGVQGYYFNLLDAEYPVGTGSVDPAPGVDLYLYHSVGGSVAFYVCGGLAFADENLYGAGLGYTVPFDFDERAGPSLAFGFHTLRGVEVSFGVTNL